MSLNSSQYENRESPLLQYQLQYAQHKGWHMELIVVGY